uniref:C-C motif chemokine n=1 Tax=Oryctolagus cuniculus TaxID=9986 RepID=G1SDU7_RABIT
IYLSFSPSTGSLRKQLGLSMTLCLHVGFHRPTDCCFSYTKRNIQCFLMQDYIETSSQCSMPAVIFLTKRGQKVCADSSDERVRKCVSSLQRDLPTRNLGIVALA